MDDLYLARMGNTQFECQPQMVGPLSTAGYEIYRFVEVKMTKQEIEKVAKEWEDYAIN